MTREIVSTESGNVTRTFTHAYDWLAGTYTRVGPDGTGGQNGLATFVQQDRLGRATEIRRGPSGNPVLKATYTYYADDLVDTVTFHNGASTKYTYDHANRVTVINHKNSSAQTFLKLTYTYSNDDVPTRIVENNGSSDTHQVDFTYDARDRLTTEIRKTLPGNTELYNLTYAYDQRGNRTTKTDTVANRRTEYVYDLSDPTAYGSKNNRLEYYLFKNNNTNALLSTTWYFYNTAGNVTRIVTKDNGDDTHTVTRFEYADNCEAVSHMVGETWETDGGDGDTCPDGYTVTGFARQFRYDEARARYLNRELNPSNLSQVLSDTWSDCDGDEIYGDYTLSGSTATNQRSFQPGIATVDTWTGSGGSNTKYYHGDLIGTTRSLTAGGSPTGASVYTAFGELVSGSNHRYGYAGAWQYQAHDFPTPPNPFVHVGARYYDSSSGRFLQRDPSGIDDDTVVYLYVGAIPTVYVDEDGYKKVKTKHGWRDSKTGRYTRAPWWRRAGKWGAKRVPVYACGSFVAYVGHKAAGKPYEDPVDIITETLENVAQATWNNLRNWWRTPPPRNRPAG